MEVKSALKASVISASTEILVLSEREHADTHMPSSGSTHHNSQSEEKATRGDASSVKDDPGAEVKEEDSSNNEALPPESTRSDVWNGGDANVQDESPDEMFEASSSSDVPPNGNASAETSEDASNVVQVTALPPVLLALKDHLTEVENSWVELHADIAAVQQKLHQVKKKNTSVFCRMSPSKRHNMLLFINPISQNIINVSNTPLSHPPRF